MGQKHIGWGLTKQDIGILFLLALIGIILSIWIYLPGHPPGDMLEIRQNGKILKTLPLDKDCEETIRSEDGGVNTFTIKNKQVSMNEASCGDHTCIQTGVIHRAGESIVCLPHRLVLQITASEKNSETNVPDAIVH